MNIVLLKSGLEFWFLAFVSPFGLVLFFVCLCFVFRSAKILIANLNNFHMYFVPLFYRLTFSLSIYSVDPTHLDFRDSLSNLKVVLLKFKGTQTFICTLILIIMIYLAPLKSYWIRNV